MTDEAAEGMRRGREELSAAQLLAKNGFDAQAVSRSYYAAFYAAEAALLLVGETRSKHSGVIATVGGVLVRQQGLDERAGRLLRSLFERRSQADYNLADVPKAEACQAVQDATFVVEALQNWIESHETN
jgi:uncharacterized protein (UPF0332 family)